MQSLVSERPDAGERAVLVHMTFYRGQENLYELKELAKSAGTEPVHVLTGARQRPDSKYFIGTGKLDELKTAMLSTCSKPMWYFLIMLYHLAKNVI